MEEILNTLSEEEGPDEWHSTELSVCHPCGGQVEEDIDTQTHVTHTQIKSVNKHLGMLSWRYGTPIKATSAYMGKGNRILLFAMLRAGDVSTKLMTQFQYLSSVMKIMLQGLN